MHVGDVVMAASLPCIMVFSFAAQYAFAVMTVRANAKLPPNEQLQHLNFYFDEATKRYVVKYIDCTRVFRLYHRHYPGGSLHLVTIALFVALLASMAAPTVAFALALT